MVVENWDSLMEDLERQELQAQGGVATPQLYSQLLAVYLYQNDLCSAKFLWKRIPESVKTQSAELGTIWSVGKAMWQRDPSQVYSTLSQTQWSADISPIMKALKEKTERQNLRLIGSAYSWIRSKTMGGLVGLSEADTMALAKEQGWRVDGSCIVPGPLQQAVSPLVSTQDQLHKLTAFVSFLEN